MSYPPEASRSCHEADGRSDRSGGSGGAVYGTIGNPLGTGGKWPAPSSSQYPLSHPFNPTHHEGLVSNWKKWSLGLDYLLQDSEGVALFKSYLQYEGCSNLLDFWFACQGFKIKIDPSDNRKITQLIKAIYRTYIRGSSSKSSTPLSSLLSDPQPMVQPRTEPIRLRMETRRLIAERISRKHSLDQTVFDPAQVEVEQFLRTTAYPAFLKSDVYVDFLQSTVDETNRGFQSGQKVTPGLVRVDPSSCLLSGLPDCSANFMLSGKTLPTLDEDRELMPEELSNHAAPVESAQPPEFMFTQHCPHCSQYHSHGHQSPCGSGFTGMLSNPPPFSPYPIGSFTPRPPGPVPFPVENMQMTHYFQAAVPSPHQIKSPLNVTRHPGQRSASGDRETLQNRTFGSKMGYPRPQFNYMYTQWVDAIRPPSLTLPTDPRLTGHLLSQPPNPYHISYAPVSTRDSERHSLSSEARTDETHSHTDSGHDGITTMFRQCTTHTANRPDRHSTAYPNVRRPRAVDSLPACPVSQSSVADHASSSTAAAAAVATTVRPPDHAHVTQNEETGAPVPRSPLCLLGEPTAQAVGEDPSRAAHAKHHRGTSRRGLSGWRGKSATSGANDPGLTLLKSSSVRSRNLAEKDPIAFSRLLTDKLQRVLDNQLATERLDRLMADASPNPPRSNEATSDQSPKKSEPQSVQPVVNEPRSVDNQSTTTGVAQLRSSTTTTTGNTTTSVLQRPWADRLLAAARVQHAETRDNAQAILEDHCSRIWAASADRTPTSGSGSGSGGGQPLLVEQHGTGGDDHLHHQLIESAPPNPPIHDDDDDDESISPVHHPFATTGAKTTNERAPMHSVLASRSAVLRSPRLAGLPRADDPNELKPAARPTKPLSSIVVPDQAAYVAREAAGSDDQTTRPSTAMISTSGTSDHRSDPLADESSSSSYNRTGDSHLCTVPPTHSPTHVIPPPGRRPMLHQAMTTVQSTCCSSSSITTSVISATCTPAILAGSPLSSTGSPHSLVIGYYMGDDPVPYRSVWPSAEITLGQFKQLIPRKKGTFRYFFKKFSDEFGSGVVHQEITNDYCVLPLWEGKVVAKVERIE